MVFEELGSVIEKLEYALDLLEEITREVEDEVEAECREQEEAFEIPLQMCMYSHTELKMLNEAVANIRTAVQLLNEVRRARRRRDIEIMTKKLEKALTEIDHAKSLVSDLREELNEYDDELTEIEDVLDEAKKMLKSMLPTFELCEMLEQARK